MYYIRDGKNGKSMGDFLEGKSIGKHVILQPDGSVCICDNSKMIRIFN